MIHEKIKKLRTDTGLSQEELARLMNISRPTLSQIELGERELKADEIQRLSEIFEMPTSEFFASAPSIVQKERLDDPNIRLKNLILYIIGKCGQKPNMGKILLNKLLYFSDFDYYEKHGESITNTIYRKLPMWPVPSDMDTILREMQEDGHIQMIEWEFFGYSQIKILQKRLPDMDMFRSSELAEVDRVVNRFSDMTGKQVSDFSHNDMPYRATKENWWEISYGLAFYRDPKHYTVRDPEIYAD
jgi:transcriptional regulator with XRE-family HTH domain